MRRIPASLVAVVCSLMLAFPAAANIEPELTREDFYLYCGYLEALELPKYGKIKSSRKRIAKIARFAKVSAKKMRKAVKTASKVGSTCDEIGKLYEEDAKKALNAEVSLKGRVIWETYVLDWSTADHVVIAVTWTGADKKKLVQEASLIAKVFASRVPIAKTIAIRGVNPRAADKTSDDAIWWEGKTSPARANHIDVKRIPDYAESRYLRLFDGVVNKVAKQ